MSAETQPEKTERLVVVILSFSANSARYKGTTCNINQFQMELTVQLTLSCQRNGTEFCYNHGVTTITRLCCLYPSKVVELYKQ